MSTASGGVIEVEEVPAGVPRGSFLEAYRPDGTPLSASNPKWPITLAWGHHSSDITLGADVLVTDLEADGRLQVIHVIPESPYPEIYSLYGPARDAGIEMLEIR